MVLKCNYVEVNTPIDPNPLRSLMRTPIIALCGPMGSGKSLAAKIICEMITSRGKTTEIISIASELKKEAKGFGWNGIKDEDGRRGLQLLGDIVRDYFHNENYWIRKWGEQYCTTRANYVICDDLRFPNEERVIRSLGGVLLQIRLNGLISVSTHQSERVDLLTPDETIWSDMGTEALKAALYKSTVLKEHI
jgi:ABC-type dipeptide/oligopeptide/nickel transport system ATPase component